MTIIVKKKIKKKKKKRKGGKKVIKSGNIGKNKMFTRNNKQSMNPEELNTKTFLPESSSSA